MRASSRSALHQGGWRSIVALAPRRHTR
jgi:hypothetical protein